MGIRRSKLETQSHQKSTGNGRREMISKKMQHASTVRLCITLFAAGAQGQQTDDSKPPTSTHRSQHIPSYSAPTVAPMTADQLDALVAPIALYPDALVAQVLGAAAAP